MDGGVLQWLLVGHIYGFMMWTGTMFGAFHILVAHGTAGRDHSPAFGPLEKSVGISMDVGATLAIVFGLLLLFLPAEGPAILKAGGFFHAKLALVAALIGCHVYLRRKIRQYKGGDLVAPPGWLFPVMSLSALAIVVLVIVRPF